MKDKFKFKEGEIEELSRERVVRSNSLSELGASPRPSSDFITESFNLITEIDSVLEQKGGKKKIIGRLREISCC